MTDAGFFKGTSADQDSRFSDKNKKLMKTMKFADNIDKKVDMKKIRLELMRPYITNILSTLTTVEDEVMVEYVFSQLEEKQHPDGKLIQIMMTGFLGKTKARTFMGELWSTLLEAQNSPHGIPAELIELKREEMQKKKVEENKINASVNKYKEEIERSLNMDRRAPAAQHQQTSATRARTPPRVIKDTVERNNERKDSKKPDTDTKQSSHRQRRSRTRSRSRSPKYQSSSSRRQRNHSRERSPARRHDNHKSSRHSERDDEQRKSSRRFREKTPDTVQVPTEEKMDSKLKALDIASEVVKPTIDEASKNKMEVEQSPKTEGGSDSSSSGSSDSESGSGSSDSDSGSGSSSSSGSESDADSSASSTTSSKKLKKKRKQPQAVGSEPALNGNGVKCAKVEGDSDVHTATNGAAKANVEALNGNGEAKEVAPLQRILQAEKRKESDRSSHRSGRDVEDDGRRRRRDEEDRRRYEEDRRRRDDDDRRRRHEQEARRYEEDRRRRDEEDRRREKEERRREEDRRLRYEEDRRREERRHREKEHEKQSHRAHRNRSESDSDDSEHKKSSSRHKKKKSSRDESDRKRSKKSKKSRSRERDHDGHRSSKTDTAEMEKSLREKALESLASKRLKEESNSN